MGITFGDHLIDSGYHDITPEQEREIEAREECARRGLDPDDDAADGVTVWMVVDKEMRERDDLQAWIRHGRIGTGRGYQSEVERAKKIDAERATLSNGDRGHG